MKLQTKLMLILIFVFLISFAAIESIRYLTIKNDALGNLRREARNIRSVLMSTRRVYHHQFLDSGIPLTDKTLGFLPAYAMSRISDDFKNWTGSSLYFNNVSDRPRNPKNVADPLEMEAIKFFRDNPVEKERFVPFKSKDDQAFYHFSAPIWIEEYCIKCHGRREDSPVAIRTNYATAFNYEVGELRGIMSIKLPAAQLRALVWANLQQDLWIQLGSFTGMFFLISWLLRRYVTAPVSRLASGLQTIGDGKYDKQIEKLPVEMATVGKTFNVMAENLGHRDKALRESKEQLQSILDNTTAVIYTKDLQGRYVLINKRYQSLFHITQEEIVGKTDYEIFPKEIADAFRANDLRVLEAQTSLEIEEGTLHGNDLHTYISIKFPLIAPDGIPYGVCGISTDITERKRAEEKLKDSYNKLKATQKASLNIMDDLDKRRMELDASLQQKELLLKEVHHRVKNNMQVVISLLKRQADCLTDENLIKMFNESQNRVKSMSLIHEKLYSAEDLSRIDFSDYITKLAEDLFRFYKISTTKVVLNIDVSDMSLNIDTAIPCGLIINEFVTNSLKYAFPDNKEGEIKISMHSIADCGTGGRNSKSKIELILSDNGIGIPEEIDYRKTESLGLSLIVNLTEHQLDGNIELDRSSGTAFRARFKEVVYRERI